MQKHSVVHETCILSLSQKNKAAPKKSLANMKEEKLNHPCVSCKNRRSILYKKIKNEKIEVSQVCTSCPLISLNKDPLSQEPLPQNHNPCQKCGLKEEEFTSQSLLGCSACYRNFHELVQKIFEKDGILPCRIVVERNRENAFSDLSNIQKEIQLLNISLQKAIDTENYEFAAQVRDQIKEIIRRS